MAAKALTNRQRQILDFIRATTREKGFPPSVREIGDAIGLKSTSSVHSHLTALEKKGYLARSSSSARALTVNKALISEMEGGEAASSEKDVDAPPLRVVSLPLVGQVAAGTPILAEQNIEDTMSLPKQIVDDSNSFLLTVHGDSMIEAGILNGDVVVVREQRSANNGDIVVAMIDGEATVKTFFKEDGRVRLQPQNPTMEPIYTTEAQILGKVTALFRSIR